MTGEMAVMGTCGDTKVIWDQGNADEVQNARETFNRLVREKKYLAFSVKQGGEKGEQVREFDPLAGKLILVPPMQGG